MANLLYHFATAVKRHPDRIAIVDAKGRETNFLQLHTRSLRLAAYWYSKGIRNGDRVLIAMPVNADLYASLAALWSLGATVVLPEPAMGIAGLRHAAQSTKPIGFCASSYYTSLIYLIPELRGLKLLKPGEASSNHPTTDPVDSDIALISFTSGTTGKPKAIPRSHGFLVAQHDAIAPLLHSARTERDLVAFPVFTLINIADGRTSVLPNWRMSNIDKLSPVKLKNWIKSQRVSRALLPPSICEKLAQTSIPRPLHTIFTGGGPVFPDIVETLRHNNELRVVSVYGSTEAEPIAHLDATDISSNDTVDMKNGKGLLVGYPVNGVEIKIRATEILVAGAHVNSGYLDPTHNVDNKIIDGNKTWHRTGDAGAFDKQGRLWLWGRTGTEVSTPAGALFPFSIEVSARYWPGVEQSALMSVNDTIMLVVQGDSTYQNEWRDIAQDFGVNIVNVIDKIPMDTRHHSKVDRTQLMDLLR